MPRPVTSGLENWLVQISPDDEVNARLGATRVRAPDPSRPPSTEFGVLSYTQWMNVPLAEAWLAEAMRYSWQEIDAMGPEGQKIAVVHTWRAFGKMWRALNVRPYAWERFRRVCSWQWGGGHAAIFDRGVAQERGSGYGWTNESSSADEFNPNWPYSGRWRRLARDEFAVQNPEADQVTFVAFGAVAASLYNVDLGDGSRRIPWGGIVRHSPDAHRLFLDDEARLTGTALDARLGWSDSPGSYAHHGCGTNWRCSARSPFEDGERVGLWFLPPLAWYWEILRHPIPGLRVGVENRDLFNAATSWPLREAATGDLSLCEYIRAVGMVALAREVRMDVWRRNSILAQEEASRRGLATIGEADLATLSEAETLRAAREGVRERASLTSLSGAVGKSLLGASATRGLSSDVSTGLAVAGLFFGVMGVVGGFIAEALGSPETAQVDVFGRFKPALESYRIVDDLTEMKMQSLLRGDQGERIHPEVHPGYMLPPDWAAVVGTPVGEGTLDDGGGPGGAGQPEEAVDLGEPEESSPALPLLAVGGVLAVLAVVLLRRRR